MCIFANEGGPKSKSSRKETPLKIKKYKEIHVSGKNLEKKFLATTPNTQGGGDHYNPSNIYIQQVVSGTSVNK